MLRVKLIAIARWAVAEVLVRLKGHADQRRNGIRQLLGELVCLSRVRFHLGSIGGVEPSNRQKKCGENGAQSTGRRFVFYTHAVVLAPGGAEFQNRRKMSEFPDSVYWTLVLCLAS